MSARDALEPLEGEANTMPGVAVSRTAPGNSRQIVAVAVFALSAVGLLVFVLMRVMTPKQDTPPPAPDVASAHAAPLRMDAPMSTLSTASPPARPASAAVIVPEILADSTSAPPVAVRGAPPVKIIAPEDAPLFAGGANSLQRPSGQPGDAGAPVDAAEGSLNAYRGQLGDMVRQLQGITNKAVGGPTVPGAGPTGMSGPGAGALAAASNFPSPPLFGSMERSATARASARTLGDRSLTLPKGTLFTCSLKTRVVTATSGFVGCQAMRNVFSDDGKVVLVERGSHLDGEYRIVQVRPGLTRIPVLWTRVRTPQGITVDLDSPATGELGESGIGGYVDNRWVERIGGALLLSLIDDAIKLSVTDKNEATGDSTVILPNTASQSSKLAEKVLEATINIPPLMFQNQAGVVGVYVARDLDFSTVYELRPQ